MNEPKTTIDLPFSPEDVRMGHHLGNAIAGYRDGNFKRSAEGMVEAVRAFQAAATEIDHLRAENVALIRTNDALGQAIRDWKCEKCDHLRAENEKLREMLQVTVHDLDRFGWSDLTFDAHELLASTAPKTEDPCQPQD